MSLSETAAAGVALDTLVALRDVLALSIEQAEPDKRAPLAARFIEVLDKIESATPAKPVEEGTALDEFTKRRAARGSGSAG